MSRSPLEAGIRSAEPDRRNATPAAPEATPARLARRVAETLGNVAADTLTATLAACVRDADQYEASVRGGRNGTLRAGRMMIERASAEILTAIADTLGVSLPPAATRWRELAQHEGVPIITGWDVRGGGNERCIKLYVNASDAAATTRMRLLAALAPGIGGLDEPPAVMGMNVTTAGSIETKVYVQSADAVALAAGLGSDARALAATARDERADAGGIVSFDAEGEALHPRAFFVALREPPDAEDWRCVRSLPAHDADAIASLMPFAPAPPRSVGISLHDGAWTLYCKPRNSGRAPEALEPMATFRAGGTEVGVFVEPTERAARAFRRTPRHAVSVRVREGTPAPHALEALVDWFAAQLRAAEGNGAETAMPLTDPPAPWQLIGTAKPFSDRGERP